jgi:outer membrane protein assembly factor BamB
MRGSRTVILFLLVALFVSMTGRPFTSVDDAAAETTRGSDTTGEWSEFRGNLNNTGYSTSTVPTRNNTFLEFQALFQIRSSAVAWGDVIYFGSDYGRVYAVNISTGMDVWNYTTGTEVWATPLVTEDRVYIGSADNNFYALNRINGTSVWVNQTGNDIHSSAKLYNGVVVFGSLDGNLYFLDADTGNEALPPFRTGGEIHGTPAIINDSAVFGSDDGKVYRVSLADGSEMWNFTGNPIEPGEVKYSSAAISGNRVYIGSNNRNLYCLDLDTGNIVWDFATGDYVYASPAIHNGRVFVHSLDGFLYALPLNDPNGDGNITIDEVIWEFETQDSGGGIEGGSSPAVADGKVIVGGRIGFLSGYVYVVDEETGNLTWRSPRLPGMFSSPTVVDGRIFIGTASGVMYGFSELAPGMELDIAPEIDVIESERLMVIEFVVTHAGEPVEGAFINFETTHGVLSQSGASTLADGIQRVKFLAPQVTESTTVTITGRATKYGMEESVFSIDIVITPAADYDTESGTVFSWDKYMPFIAAIVILALVNVTILIAIRFKGRPQE